MRDDVDGITISGRPESTAPEWAIAAGPARLQSPSVRALDAKVVKALKDLPTPARVYWEPADEAAIQESGG